VPLIGFCCEITYSQPSTHNGREEESFLLSTQYPILTWPNNSQNVGKLPELHLEYDPIFFQTQESENIEKQWQFFLHGCKYIFLTVHVMKCKVESIT
jgi:hypothetical protein